MGKAQLQLFEAAGAGLETIQLRIIGELPSESLGAYVISMTRTTSDILTVSGLKH